MQSGLPIDFEPDLISSYMQKRRHGKYLVDDSILIRLAVGKGLGMGVAWGCDLSAEYVRINADYTT